MPHHTKDKGDLGVFKAQADLASQGFCILLPLTEHAPFDLVVYKDTRFLRVQVKYRKVRVHSELTVPFKQSWTDKHGTHETYIDKNLVDVYCVYCPDTDECYYFDPKQFSKHVNLRVHPPKNNARKNIHFASDFRRVP